MLGTEEERAECHEKYLTHKEIMPMITPIPGQMRVYREFIEDAIKEKLIRLGASEKESTYLFYGKNKLEDDLMGCILTPIKE